MTPLGEALTGWPAGVNTTLRPDRLPPTASPRGLNSYLTNALGGEAVVGKRRGASVFTTTPITASPAVIGQYAFLKRSALTLTSYHVALTDTGRLELISNTGGLTNLATGLDTSGAFPDFEVANNHLFFVNGTDRKKYDGTTVTEFGIAEPSTACVIADAGSGSNHNGTYEGRYTFYNGTTGQESSASATSNSLTLTNNAIDWSSVDVSSDSQVTARRLYLRNTATMTTFRLVATISDNTSTTAQTDVADSSLVTLGPDTEENDRVPSTVRFLAWHNSRMFAADGQYLYYSKVGFPEAFDPDFYEPVNADDGQSITGLHVAQDVLLIFKSNTTYALYGDDPQTWVVRPVSTTIGCTSHRSVVAVEDKVYWWSEQGPAVWDGATPPRLFGREVLSPTVGPDGVNQSRLNQVVACVDFPRDHVIFWVPGLSQTRNTIGLPYNYRLGAFDSSLWDPFDVASAATVEDSNGQPWVFLGGYSGRVYKWWNADSDGVPTGSTTTGTFVAASTSVTTVTDATATFPTTNGGLTDCKVTILNSDGYHVGSTRQRISSNTATGFTLGTAVAGLTAAATYTYIVGGPDWQWDTYWSDLGDAFSKKRMLFLYLQMASSGSSVTIRCDLAFNFDTSSGQTKALTFDTSAPSSVWDEAIWDTSAYGTLASVNSRQRIGRTGWTWRARLRNAYADQSATLYKVGIRGIRLSDKQG